MAHQSKYATKVLSGNQMYGNGGQQGRGCCAHGRIVTQVPRDKYWWGELRKEQEIQEETQEEACDYNVGE